MKNQQECPNCGRKLTESELYCYFCDFDISRIGEEKTKTIRQKREISFKK